MKITTLHRKSLLMVIFCVCCALFTTAQSIKNVRADFDGEKIIISYDLVSADPDQKFKVSLYSSHNNYERPLSLLIGDQGESVSVGERNRVIWDVKSSLPVDFDNDITIKVRAAKVIVPVATGGAPAKLSMKPFDHSAIKKGKTLNLNWVGGSPNDKINIELFKGDAVVQQIATVDNKNRYEWTVPKKSKAGKNYTIRISKSGNVAELSNSQFFQIKPKTALIVKMLPLLVIGGVVVFLSKPSSVDESTIELADLPGPVKPN